MAVPLRVEVAIEIDGDHLKVNLTGSNDQFTTGYNCPFSGSTQVIVYSMVRSILLDEATSPVGHTFFVSYSGLVEARNEYWVYIEVNETSYGGRPSKDGLDAVDCLMADTRNNPIEELELRNPMRCLEYELRPGPGAGRWRGGMGVIRTWECLTDTLFSGEGDGASGISPTRGLFGGRD